MCVLLITCKSGHLPLVPVSPRLMPACRGGGRAGAVQLYAFLMSGVGGSFRFRITCLSAHTWAALMGPRTAPLMRASERAQCIPLRCSPALSLINTFSIIYRFFNHPQTLSIITHSNQKRENRKLNHARTVFQEAPKNKINN